MQFSTNNIASLKSTVLPILYFNFPDLPELRAFRSSPGLLDLPLTLLVTYFASASFHLQAHLCHLLPMY